MSDLVGQTLGGYEVVAKLGHGGMGTVYRARDPQLQRFVALKLLPPQFGDDDEYVTRGECEATFVEVSTTKPMKSVIIAADSNWGTDAYGLSEVRFVKRRVAAVPDGQPASK